MPCCINWQEQEYSIRTLNDLQLHACVANPWWDNCSSKPESCVLRAPKSGGLALCDAVSSTSDLITMSLSATELRAGVTHPLWDAYWDRVWWAGTSPEVQGEKGLPLWWRARLCQHKCQVSPSCRKDPAKCTKCSANAFIICASGMNSFGSFEKEGSAKWHSLEKIRISF